MAEILFHPEAAREYRDSLNWYAERSRRSAERFEQAIDLVLNQILEKPSRYGQYDDNHREAILTRFPFSMIYRVMPNGDVLIIAIAHASREPGYWELRSLDKT